MSFNLLEKQANALISSMGMGVIKQAAEEDPASRRQYILKKLEDIEKVYEDTAKLKDLDENGASMGDYVRSAHDYAGTAMMGAVGGYGSAVGREYLRKDNFTNDGISKIRNVLTQLESSKTGEKAVGRLLATHNFGKYISHVPQVSKTKLKNVPQNKILRHLSNTLLKVKTDKELRSMLNGTRSINPFNRVARDFKDTVAVSRGIAGLTTGGGNFKELGVDLLNLAKDNGSSSKKPNAVKALAKTIASDVTHGFKVPSKLVGGGAGLAGFFAAPMIRTLLSGTAEQSRLATNLDKNKRLLERAK